MDNMLAHKYSLQTQLAEWHSMQAAVLQKGAACKSCSASRCLGLSLLRRSSGKVDNGLSDPRSV